MKSSTLRAVGGMVRRGQVVDLTSAVRDKLYGERRAVGLRRDLHEPFESPDARMPISVRPAQADDVARLLRPSPDDSASDLLDKAARQAIADAGLRVCWVAVTEDGTPCYMQWLLDASQRDEVHEHFKGTFPPLTPDTALLEGAYTPPEHRGQRIMPAAMARIAAHAGQLGARYVITFVGDGNVPSLKGCERAGFAPYLRRTERFRLGHCHVDFAPV